MILLEIRELALVFQISRGFIGYRNSMRTTHELSLAGGGGKFPWLEWRVGETMAVSAHLRGHGTPINVENWRRYATSCGLQATFPMILEVTFCPGCHPRSGHVLTGGDVEGIFRHSHPAGSQFVSQLFDACINDWAG
jgi:hypothetical protein